MGGATAGCEGNNVPPLLGPRGYRGVQWRWCTVLSLGCRLYSGVHEGSILLFARSDAYRSRRVLDLPNGPKNGLHADGYNSAESEPIWMKFGTLWANCWGLAMAGFERDPRSSDSLRGSRNFFWSVKSRRISPISRRTIFTNFAHNNGVWCHNVNFPNIILKILS